MAMVHVAHVRMSMHERVVAMDVRMRLARVDTGFVVVLVLVSMVLVVYVHVLVLERFVRVEVAVALGEHERDARGHDRRCCSVAPAESFRQQRHGDQRADERRGREDGRLARGAEGS
jgi:hypothetical protein